jgi:pimeloyl-ACP methyl ester carboxylesterase
MCQGRDMCAVEPTHLECDGARLAVRVSGRADGPPVVLVHGGGAHAGWWGPMQHHLGDHFRLIAFDLSGHGDSDHRGSYTMALWVSEIAAVLQSVGSPALLVGHSMGGALAVQCAADYPELIAGLVTFDSMPDRTLVRGYARDDPSPRPPYPTYEQIAQRFRLRPAQPMPSRDVVESLIRHSVRRSGPGWSWKSDIHAQSNYEEPGFLDGALPRVETPALYVFAQHSPLGASGVCDLIAQDATNDYGLVSVPGTHHHLVLDRPRACAELLIHHADPWTGRAGAER